MRKIFLVLAVVFLASSSVMAQDGVKFETGTLQDALTKAQKEKKIIFLDAYATWCGPCKMMSSKVFPDPKAGEYFNKNFINVKFDMENGEGIQIAKKYKVTAYPTFLLLNDRGEEVGRIVGAATVDDFIKKVEAERAKVSK